jgi:hypothetical protein
LATSASNGGLTASIDRQVADRQRKVARQSGRDGLDRSKVTRGRADLESAYDEGAEEGQPAPTKGGGKTGGKPGEIRQAWRDVNRQGPSWGQALTSNPFRPRPGDAGGFIAGLALYTVAIIYVRYGPEGWRAWLSAKFLNKPLTTGTDGVVGPRTKSGGKAAV